jgi:hypothetical protein
MAVVTEFQELTTHQSRVHPTETECRWAAFEADGKQYLQLDTGGSDDRRNPGKVSQTLQSDREGAAKLLRILQRDFPGII